MKKLVLVAGLSVAVLGHSVEAAAQIRSNAGFNTHTLARNDDGYTGPVSIGFNVDFFGTALSQLSVNNNGNVTFDAGMSTYSPFSLLSTGKKILAPFFTDVDTRNTATNPVTYGQDVVNGRQAFGVNWSGVGEYSYGSALNFFQLVLIDRSDVNTGDFDFEFNYGDIVWDHGNARVGWSDGSTHSFEADGSGVAGAFVNGGSHSLKDQQRLSFQVRNGAVSEPVDVTPEPVSIVLLGSGLLGLGVVRRRQRVAR